MCQYNTETSVTITTFKHTLYFSYLSYMISNFYNFLNDRYDYHHGREEGTETQEK